MTKKLTIYFLIFFSTFFSCVICDKPIINDYPCDIKTEKSYIVPIAKSELFKLRFTEQHPYSLTTLENLQDTMYYLYCEANEKWSDAVFECKVKAINKDSTLIQTYRVVWFSIHADKHVKDKEIYYTNLGPTEYQKLFGNNFISQITKENERAKLYQDNKKIHDLWQVKDKHIHDSLRKKLHPK